MKSLVISIKNNPYTAYVLGAGIVCSFFLYMYFINGAVRHAVVRSESEAKILSVKNKISDLEYLYMASNNSITMDLAKSYGLSEPKEKTFISRNQNKSLSFK